MITDLSPFIIFGQILGYFPFRIRKEAPHISNISPFLMVYSLCVHTFGCYCTTRNMLLKLPYYTGDVFQNKVFYMIFVSYGIFFFLIVIWCWFSGSALVKYFQQWCGFQFYCKLYTGKSPLLNLKSICRKYFWTFLALTIVGPLSQRYFSAEIDFFFQCSSFLLGGVVFYNFGLFITSCISCKLSFHYLGHSLSFILKYPSSHTSSQMKQYRALFHFMYQIVNSTGSSFAGPWVLMFCFFLSSYVISSFVCAMGLLGNFDGTIVPYLSLSLMSVNGILIFCFCGDLVRREVSISVSIFCAYLSDYLSVRLSIFYV